MEKPPRQTFTKDYREHTVMLVIEQKQMIPADPF